MPGYKKRIFIRAVKARMEAEQITSDVALEDYPKLTEEEKVEIMEGIYEDLIAEVKAVMIKKDITAEEALESLDESKDLSDKEKEVIVNAANK